MDILVHARRNKGATKRFFHKLFRRWAQPHVLITDKLQPCATAKAEITPSIEHRQHKGLNNRAEASHCHTRRREKVMGRFKSPGQAQRFLSVYDQTAFLFRPKRHRLSAAQFRQTGLKFFHLWNIFTGKLAA